MTTPVLDTSAVLAWLRSEPGADVVDPLLPHAVMSAVNWAELAAKLAQKGAPVIRTLERLTVLGIKVQPFGSAAAVAAGLLWPHTHQAGLSLGDRACLATAQTLVVDAVVVTADTAWTTLDLTGITLQLIR
jgi:PIN domain nuclease of toxin-antitoxin system